MLLRNGERYTLTPADYKLINQYFPKFPARLTYPKERVQKNAKNILPDKPTSITSPFFATKKTEKGTESWRFCEHEILGDNGTKAYSPTHISLRGTMVITEMDKELAFWLVNACPYLKDGLNFDKNRVAKYVIENLISDAEIKVAEKEQEAEVNALIYSKIGLSEERLRQIASAMYINGVSELSLPQVRLAIDREIKRDKLKGAKKFLEMADAKEVLAIKSTIQKAVDNKVIIFNKSKKEWSWVMGQGKKNELITKINPTVQENDALYTYYMGNPSFAEMLMTAVNVNDGGDPEE